MEVGKGISLITPMFYRIPRNEISPVSIFISRLFRGILLFRLSWNTKSRNFLNLVFRETRNSIFRGNPIPWSSLYICRSLQYPNRVLTEFCDNHNSFFKKYISGSTQTIL